MKLKVFFSWQTETEPYNVHCKSFLKASICRVLKNIQNKGKLSGINFEFHEGLRTESGTPYVDEAMFQQIRECDLFIGDFSITEPELNDTIRSAYEKTGTPLPRRKINENVLIETQTAFNRYDLFYQQVILVMNDIWGIPKKDGTIIPFDFSRRRWPINFHLPADSDNLYRDVAFENTLSDALIKATEKAKRNKDDKYHPFIGWHEQAKFNEFKGRFLWNDNYARFKQQILNNNDGLIRLIGLSGMGKSYLAFESFRGEDKSDNYLYCDCATEDPKEIKTELKIIFKEYQEAYIILDNCKEDFLEDILSLKIKFHSKNPILSIYNDPSEIQGSDRNKISLNYEKNNDTVLQIINEIPNVTDELKPLLIKFAGGIPFMAYLLAQGLADGKPLGDMSNEREMYVSLMNKLLGCKKDSTERTMLQALALFKFVGWQGDKKNQLEFIAKDKDITSVEIQDEQFLMNEFERIILHNIKRAIIEQVGRMVGLRPMPLAQYLILEWFDKCTPERLLRVINDLQGADVSPDLKYHLGEQFRYMGFSQQAVEFVNGVLGANSPFGSAEVINTEVGSHLFRIFVEVNPGAVANCLARIILPMSVDELKNLKEGRRNIVWTVEKICFDKHTFLIGAKIMLRLAVAENEKWSNNATGDFVGLFPIILPATAADFNSRLAFLRDNLKGDQKELIFKALKRALYCHNFTFMSGPEFQGTKKLDYYMPKGEGEIITYISGCLDILSSALPQDIKQIKNILEEDSLSLCEIGAGDEVLPLIKKTCILLKYDWEKMRSNMSLLKEKVFSHLSESEKSLYEDILKSLTKTDIASTFARIENESYNIISGKNSFDEQEKWRNDKYTNLAEQFARQYDKDTLIKLSKAQVNIVNPFGSTLYDLWTDEEKVKFVNDYVTILNSVSYTYCHILLDFFTEVTEEEFKSLYEPIIYSLKDKRVIFGIVAKIGASPDSLEFIKLKVLINNGEAKVEDFLQYWGYWPFVKQNLESVLSFFKQVLKYDGGYQVICHIYSFASMERFHDNKEKIELVIMDSIKKQKKLEVLFNDYTSIQCIKKLLTENANAGDFAKSIHQKLLQYVLNRENLLHSQTDIQHLYSLLIDKYFSYIWDDLSSAIASYDEDSFFDLKIVLGSWTHKQEYLFNSKNWDAILKSCQQYPNIVPARMISLIPTYGEANKLHPLILKILDIYGDQQNVCDEVGYSIGTYSGAGSRIPYLKRQLKALEPLKSSKFVKVRKWTASYITYIQKEIETQKEREAEFDALHHS